MNQVMSASASDLEASLFVEPSFEEQVLRFAGDGGCQVVYITKERFATMDDDGTCGETSGLQYLP